MDYRPADLLNLIKNTTVSCRVLFKRAIVPCWSRPCPIDTSTWNCIIHIHGFWYFLKTRVVYGGQHPGGKTRKWGLRVGEVGVRGWGENKRNWVGNWNPGSTRLNILYYVGMRDRIRIGEIQFPNQRRQKIAQIRSLFGKCSSLFFYTSIFSPIFECFVFMLFSYACLESASVSS